jgi:hypothetical protein
VAWGLQRGWHRSEFQEEDEKMKDMTTQLMSICLGAVFALTGCAIEPAQEMTDDVASLSDKDVADKDSAFWWLPPPPPPPPPVATPAPAPTLSCSQAQWQDPMRAALAVSMAREIGRIDTLKDLSKSDRVYLTQDAKNRCASRGFGACNNTQAILDLQLSTVNNYIPQNIFSATSFREDLKASFDRQTSHENNLRQNLKSKVPGDYELSQVGTFEVPNACGVHFEFSVQGTNIQNVQERLVFFGGAQNPYIAFIATEATIAIDPSRTMNGDGSTDSGSVINSCTATNMSLKDKACSCGGKTGKLRPAPWNLSSLYCAT